MAKKSVTTRAAAAPAVEAEDSVVETYEKVWALCRDVHVCEAITALGLAAASAVVKDGTLTDEQGVHLLKKAFNSVSGKLRQRRSVC